MGVTAALAISATASASVRGYCALKSELDSVSLGMAGKKTKRKR
jgi:hypothetical protein